LLKELTGKQNSMWHIVGTGSVLIVVAIIFSFGINEKS
jgi:hypothetical protein